MCTHLLSYVLKNIIFTFEHILVLQLEMHLITIHILVYENVHTFYKEKIGNSILFLFSVFLYIQAFKLFYSYDCLYPILLRFKVTS